MVCARSFSVGLLQASVVLAGDLPRAEACLDCAIRVECGVSERHFSPLTPSDMLVRKQWLHWDVSKTSDSKSRPQRERTKL